MGVIKLITTLFIQMDFWDNVKEFVLSPFGDPRIELVVVMLIIPFFVNVSLGLWMNRLVIKCIAKSKRAMINLPFCLVASQHSNRGGLESVYFGC